MCFFNLLIASPVALCFPFYLKSNQVTNLQKQPKTNFLHEDAVLPTFTHNSVKEEVYPFGYRFYWVQDG